MKSFIFLVRISKTEVIMEILFKDSGINYTESKDSFPFNPARGHSPAPWFILNEDGTCIRAHGGLPVTFTPASYKDSGMATPMFSLVRFSSGNNFFHDQPQNYKYVKDRPHIVGGVNKDITPEALATIESAFAAAKQMGVALVPRFGYSTSYAEDGRGWGVVGTEPDDIKWIERHIEQVCEIINRYKSTVFAVEAGIIGPWGEMHSSMYCTDEGMRDVMNAWFKHLDPEVALTVRQLRYVTNAQGITGKELLERLPLKEDDPYYRVGLYNDGYMISGEDCYTFAHPSEDSGQILHRQEAVEFMKDQHKRAPYGGEIGYASSLSYMRDGTGWQTKSYIYDNSFIKELYDTHLCYLHNIVENHIPIRELKSMHLEHRHDFEGMPDISSYYGESLYKFILDHMGYRFVLRDAKVGVGEDRIICKGKVENVGFSNLFPKMTAEILLFDNTNGVTVYPCDIDPRKWESATVSEYEFTLPKPEKPGVYRVCLRLATQSVFENQSAYTIKFANETAWDFYYCANRIGDFKID